ncbi:MAG: hypothetical protein LBV54_07660 [Puniceicoccales bacterium]|jgi:hypothetical protein|nr:hypothetical protein [Puniceicoccales bacterium]
MPKNTKQQDPRKGDDRNLVLVDQDFGQPDLEDRMWLFWLRNKIAILGVIFLLIAAALGGIGWHALADYRLSALQAEYLGTADSPEAKLAFARARAGEALAGVAALDVADQYFKDKKYAEAAAAYALARDNFTPTDKAHASFGARAILGLAFSKLRSDDRDGGIAVLTELSRTTAYPEAFRGQALHTLALLSIEKKDWESARRWLDTLDRSISPGNIWVLNKRDLIALLPELRANPSDPLPPADGNTPTRPAE